MSLFLQYLQKTNLGRQMLTEWLTIGVCDLPSTTAYGELLIQWPLPALFIDAYVTCGTFYSDCCYSFYGGMYV